MLVVPVSDSDPGPPLQGVPRVEAAAEDPVGRGVQGDREVEESVESPGPPRRWEVQRSCFGNFLLLRRWKDGFRSRTMREASARSGSYGSAGGGKWRGRLRRRSWVPRGNWVLGRSFRCSYPCPPSWHPQTRTRGGACFRLSASPAFFLFFSRSVFSSLWFPWCAPHLLGTGLDGGQSGACNVPPPRGQRTGKTDKMYAAIV